MYVFMVEVMVAMLQLKANDEARLFKCAISEAGLYDINAQYSSGDIKMMRGGKISEDALVMEKKLKICLQ